MQLNTDQQQKYDDTLDSLAKHRVRFTPQRRAIIKYLICSDRHPSAEDIYDDLADEFDSLSLATVYNNLRLLVKLNVVKELKSGGGASHYDFELNKHYHVICRECGRIMDLDYPMLTSLENFAAERTGYRIDGHQIEFYGLCPLCLEEQQAK